MGFFQFWYIFLVYFKMCYKNSNSADHRTVTCECFCAGIHSRQPFRGPKVGDLQDAAVGVDEHIVSLKKKRTRKDLSAGRDVVVLSFHLYGARASVWDWMCSHWHTCSSSAH